MIANEVRLSLSYVGNKKGTARRSVSWSVHFVDSCVRDQVPTLALSVCLVITDSNAEHAVVSSYASECMFYYTGVIVLVTRAATRSPFFAFALYQSSRRFFKNFSKLKCETDWACF